MNELLAITIDMRAPGGYIEYCRFSLTISQQAALDLFMQLQGTTDAGQSLPLRISLASLDTTPAEVLAVSYCRLDELAWNCRLITREIFKYHNLG